MCFLNLTSRTNFSPHGVSSGVIFVIFFTNGKPSQHHRRGMGDFAKKMLPVIDRFLAAGLKIAQMAKFRPIWSHCVSHHVFLFKLSFYLR
jgi:hypothetical protein